MSKDRKSRAFIIGDKEHGLTIVITDPVMVLHYSKGDLLDPQFNDMAGKDLNVSLAGIAQELVQYFRTDINLLDSVESKYRDGTVPATFEKIEALLSERDNAATIGRIIRANGSVHDVDFCLAMTIEPTDLEIRARSVGPATEIRSYLLQFKDSKTVPAASQRFKINNLKTDNLEPLDPWRPEDGEA